MHYYLTTLFRGLPKDYENLYIEYQKLTKKSNKKYLSLNLLIAIYQYIAN